MRLGRIGVNIMHGPWKNPYVTNGLLAMWDAEWNVGLYKHDKHAMEWVDLSGHGLTMHSNGNPIFYKNYIQPTQYSEMFHTDDTNLMDDVLENGEFTMEVATDQRGIAKQCIFGDNPGASSVWIAAIGNINDPIRRGVWAKVGSININIYTKLSLFGLARCRCDGSSGTAWYHAFDNIENPISKSANISTPIPIAGNRRGFQIGYRYGYYPDGPMVDGTKVYCIRWYNRALTDDELAHNLLVDKQRFAS